MESTLTTQPPHSPPLTSPTAAHRRVSAGSAGSAARSVRLARSAGTRAPCSALKPGPDSPINFTEPSSLLRLIERAGISYNARYGLRSNGFIAPEVDSHDSACRRQALTRLSPGHSRSLDERAGTIAPLGT